MVKDITPGAGAPTVQTPELVNKLLAAFNNGLNITEACDYAQISRQTYYNWIEADKGLLDKLDAARRAPNVKAKEVIINAINSSEPDVSTAKWWLERKDPEFKAKGELMMGNKYQEEREALREFLDERHNSADDAGGAEPTAADPTDGGEPVAHLPQDIS